MSPIELKLDHMLTLLIDIRDVLHASLQQEEYEDADCRCVRISGEPIANCPICKGTGRAAT